MSSAGWWIGEAWRWFWYRLGTAVAVLCVISLFVGFFGWMGAATQQDRERRCAHAYPDSGLMQERCFARLSRGEDP
jgi:uncharacterized SAM-binding protein YcdF (DUF218 family)